MINVEYNITLIDDKGERADITNNLYAFEELGIRGVDCLEDHYGTKYAIEITAKRSDGMSFQAMIDPNYLTTLHKDDTIEADESINY